MYTAQLRFVTTSEDDEHEAKVVHIIHNFLGGLRGNGQICGHEFPILTAAQGFFSFVLIPDTDALDPAHYNRYLKRFIQEFEKLGVPAPTFTIVGEDAEGADPCDCEQREWQMLFTTYAYLESPLRCGTCFGPIPLYRIPPTYDDAEYYDIRCWETDYQACDELQMGCQTLEKRATQELSRLHSSLSRQGLKICQKLTASSGIATYYYLYRSGGRSVEREKARRCPSCRGEWLLPGPLHGKFDFKCDRCHLLSNIAWNVR